MASENLPKETEVLVIGAGIVGICTAYYLAQRGADVVLVDKGQLSFEQSSRNWGWIRQQGRNPREVPLAMLSMRLWAQLSQDLSEDIEFTQGGSLLLAYTQEHLNRCKSWVAATRPMGLKTEVLSPSEAKEVIPTLESDFVGGVYTPTDAQAEPRKAPYAIVRAAQENGAKVFEYCAVNKFRVKDGVIDEVETDKGPIKPKHVVCAAGAFSRKLVDMIGIDLPQGVVRATAACTNPASEVSRTVVWGPGVTFRQKADGRMYIAGGTRTDYDITLDSFKQFWLFFPAFKKNRRNMNLHVGRPLINDILHLLPWSAARSRPFAHTVDVEPKPNMDIIRPAYKQLLKLLPSIGDVGIEKAWAGRIDASPDATPVIGKAPGRENFIIATGFSGHGFAFGPGAGYSVAQLILDGKTDVDLHPFRVSRFKEKDLADWTKTI